MSARPRLPLLQVVLGAFAFPVLYPREYLQSISGPLLVATAGMLLWFAGQDWPGVIVQATSYVVYVATLCWLAVRVHRFVLLGPEQARLTSFARARNALSRYTAVGVAGWIVYVLLLLASLALVMNLLLPMYISAGEAVTAGTDSRTLSPDAREMFDRVALAVRLALAYLAARVMLVLPAIALEQKLDLRTAWAQSRGNGWRLVIATLLLPTVVSYAMEALLDASTSIVLIGFVAALNAILVAVGVTALSLSHRELAPPPAPPPTPPPS